MHLPDFRIGAFPAFGFYVLEVTRARADNSPCIHGLLNVLADRVFHSPNRARYSSNSGGDWIKASGLLVSYLAELPNKEFSGLSEDSVEAYLRRGLSFKARRLSLNRETDQGAKRNWDTAVEMMANDVMVVRGGHLYYSRVAA